MKTPSVLAIIPARQGSKRIPGKNTKSFRGKPLVQWTIEAALVTPLISQIVVTTDDPLILALQNLFPKVSFLLRPANLCGDDVPGIDPVLFEMSRAKQHDYVLLLQPTSPLRTERHITAALNTCFANGLDQLIGVRKPLPGDKFTFESQRQLWTINGALYVSRWQYLLDNKKFLTETTFPYEMDRKSSIDIDTVEDWNQAQRWAEELP